MHVYVHVFMHVCMHVYMHVNVHLISVQAKSCINIENMYHWIYLSIYLSICSVCIYVCTICLRGVELSLFLAIKYQRLAHTLQASIPNVTQGTCRDQGTPCHEGLLHVWCLT